MAFPKKMQVIKFKNYIFYIIEEPSIIVKITQQYCVDIY